MSAATGTLLAAQIYTHIIGTRYAGTNSPLDVISEEPATYQLSDNNPHCTKEKRFTT